MSGIGGNEPTGYNYAAADTLKAKASNLQGKLYGQQGSRSSAVWYAMREFRGYYSEVFDRNAEVASDGRREVANALGQLAGWVVELKEAAEAEDQRREEARAWAERQRQRDNNLLVGAWHEVTTWFGGGDDPQPPPAQDPPNFHSDVVQVKGREIDPPAGSSSTSSAAPADLRHFQTRTGELDDELATAVSQFQSALSDYEAGCNSAWGYLNGQPVLTAMNSWLEDNANDAQWAGLVAEAFEAAGGEGRITMADASIAAALANAGVDSHRDNLTIEPFSAVGSQPTTGFADDPVNTSTGNFLEPEHDLVFSDAAASLRFSRMYNSLDDRTGVFGFGWSSVLDTRLELDDEGARFIMEDGRQITFPRAGDGWDRGVGENYWLTDVLPERLTYVAGLPERVLTVTDNEGNWWAFAPTGIWVAAGTGPGTTVSVVRDDAGDITRLSHDRGRFIDVEYAADRVVSVHASDGRRIEYLYDDQRRLTEVTSASGTRTYRWNDAGLIDQVVAADGVIEVVNTYDAKGRVTRQLTPYGRSVRFAYLRGRVTSVSTDDGGGANTWIADRKGRLVGIIDVDGNRQSMAYDPHGNIVSATERDGQVTVHAYDDRGRKTRTVTPEGADITYGYDEHDRVTTVVTATGGVVEYEYANAADRNPSIIIDPVGGRTQLNWSAGLLTQVIDPEGVQLTFSHNEHGEMTAVTNAAGDTIQLVRDHAGRVTQAITAGGAVTEYRYNDQGELASRQDPDGAIWRFEYGAGGKVTGLIDPLGGRTELAYGPSGDLAVITDQLGRTITKDFDEFGNLSTVTLPDDTQWTFTHDALSRLREVIDPAGGVWSREYDVNGQVTALIDPTGVRSGVSRSREDGIATVRNAFEQTTINHDEYGRPVQVKHHDGAVELISYDACGRPIELVAADGGLTKIERDLAGRIIAITTAADQTTRYEYDACGRPVTAIDPTGGRTSLTYNADSRVIKMTNPAGDVATTEYDAVGRVIRRVVPGFGVARYRYDKLGRLVGIQDHRYGQRSFQYDAAGQLTKITNGVGGITTYAYDARGRLTQVTDPTGGVTRHTYTELDQIASVTDPLGRTTTAIYDPAGRQTSQTDPDGHITQWVHDAAGREIGMKIDDHWVAKLEPNEHARTVVFTDYTGDAHATHTLVMNLRGQCTRRTTTIGQAEYTTQWEYDVVGNRTAMIDNAGRRTQYHRDLLGRITRITHPDLPEIQLSYDAAGRVREAQTDGQLHTWEYANGFPVTHTRSDDSGVSRTQISRDDIGRITALDGPDGVTQFSYDNACQLIGATSPVGQQTWTYDLGGRLIRETSPSSQRDLTYDIAGQLQTIMDAEGTQTQYLYDGQGRRIQELTPETITDYVWDARGWLTSVTERGTDGEHETNLWVNALGELTQVDGNRLHWDLGAAVPQLIGVDDTAVLRGPAGFTGLGDQWQAAGWRTVRATDGAEPWQTLSAAESYTSGMSLSADGGIQIAGLEWLGARAYDPMARGFLSVDPLAPPPGAGWSANPYSYAGNDPLHALDPLGLSPVTDAELQEYADGLQGPLATGFNAAVDWTKDNWEYLAAGAAVAVGIGFMATGVGGPVGAAIISGAFMSGGLSIGTQKYQNGEVNWKQVGVDAAVGGAMGGLGAGAGNLTKSMLLKKSSTARNAVGKHADDAAVVKGSDSLWAKLNGNTKLDAASKVEATTNTNMAVDNFTRSLASDTVSNMTTANVGYFVDVATNPDKDLNMRDFVWANGQGLLNTTVSTTVKSGSLMFGMPTDVTAGAPLSDRASAFAREAVPNVSADALTTYADWQVQGASDEGLAPGQRTADMVNIGASTLGSGMNTSVPEMHLPRSQGE